MRPEVGKIYQMKASYIEKIRNKHFKIMPHVYGCGNKFEFVSHLRRMMMCVVCKHSYETNMSNFFVAYKLVKDTNPNALFKRKHNVR